MRRVPKAEILVKRLYADAISGKPSSCKLVLENSPVIVRGMESDLTPFADDLTGMTDEEKAVAYLRYARG